MVDQSDAVALVAWLKEQIAEDEREIAKHPDDAPVAVPGGLVATCETNYPCYPILEISKRRALADIESKRRILDLHAPVIEGQDSWAWFAGSESKSERIVRLLALPYADRPGYHESWRP